jgi:hypothetical protein
MSSRIASWMGATCSVEIQIVERPQQSRRTLERRPRRELPTNVGESCDAGVAAQLNGLHEIGARVALRRDVRSTASSIDSTALGDGTGIRCRASSGSIEACCRLCSILMVAS